MSLSRNRAIVTSYPMLWRAWQNVVSILSEDDLLHESVSDVPEHSNIRFQTRISELNSLFINFYDDYDDYSHHDEMHSCSLLGTAESIVNWGSRANLDENQQSAFEMMAAVFVLSFIDDADLDVDPSLQTIQVQYDLNNLARTTNDGRPMCLFVTGPAGSGKCMYIVLFCLNRFVL